GQDHPFYKRITLTPLAPFAPTSLPLHRRQGCTLLEVILYTGGCPCDRRLPLRQAPLPLVAPRGRSSIVPVGGACVGVAPLRVLPLRPRRRQASPLAGRPRVGAIPTAWLRASAAPYGLAAGDRPCRGPGRGQPPLQRAWLWPPAPFPRCVRCKKCIKNA
ncbi:hypothetical protein BHM03_00051779, partial [Ensete ventricosum]